MADRPLSWSLLVVLLGAIVVTLFPIFWIVMTAIKPPTDWNAVPAIWIPSEPTLVNFRTLFNPEAIREYGVGGVSRPQPCRFSGRSSVRPRRRCCR